ncbi:MAG: O-antigen ligase family protein [Patescibacteria group bacterium]|nr:O-antigen ligase family protein [Patescibacteria group bacterium]
MLFPFITSKQIYFNILIEVLFIFWLAFIIKYPEWSPFAKATEDKPKKSWISFGLIGFFIAMILSCFAGVDFNLSFWGDVERMLGVFHLLHFLVFYFIIITVMRTWRDWRNLFIVSITAAVLVCLYGLIKNEHYSTIGNTAYVSGYAIFNIYFALILFFRWLRGAEDKAKSWWHGLLCLAAIITMLLIFKLTHTRGAYVGLGVSTFAMLLFFIMLSKSRKIKLYCLSAFAVIAILVSLVFAYPNSAVVEKSSILRTMTAISSQAVTFQTRLIAWKAGIKDLKNHLILGTGHGNFAITFDKHFDPAFYNYTRSETYFDRAHNNLIDIVSTTGILGLITYLSIFAAVGYYLVKGFKNRQISLTEFVLLTGLIIAYFIQNLAVFDSLVTYISLMVMLGFIYCLASSPFPYQEEGSKEADKPLIDKEIYALFICGALMLIVIYQYNIKPLKMLKNTIDGQIAFAQGDVLRGVEEYKTALSYKTVLDRDSRASLINAIFSNRHLLSQIDKEQAEGILDWTVELAKENVKYNPQDSMMQMQLAQVLNTVASLRADNLDEFYFYSNQAEEAINKAIKASPGRVPIYFLKTQIYLTRGDKEKAIKTMQYAVSLNKEYYDSYCHLGRMQLNFQREEEGFKAMDQCIDLGGTVLLSPAAFVKNLINHYADQQDWQKVIKLYNRLTQLEPNNTQIWVNLAKFYEQEGEIEKAIEAAEKSAVLDPSLKDAVEQFIRGLE